MQRGLEYAGKERERKKGDKNGGAGEVNRVEERESFSHKIPIHTETYI